MDISTSSLIEEKEDFKKSSKQIAILFLAHQGIAHPETWVEWRNESKQRDNILFYAISPEDIHWENQENWIRVPLVRSTGWCEPSLIYAEQEGIQRILADDHKEKIRLTYFISGTDIPIRSADYIYSLPEDTQLCGANDIALQWKVLNRADMEFIAHSDLDEIMKSTQKKLKHPTTRKWEIENQGNHISYWENLIEEIKKNESAVNNVTKAKLGTLNYRLFAEERALEMVKSKENFNYYAPCPDEYSFPRILTKKHGKEWREKFDACCPFGQSKPYYPSRRFSPVGPSPIEWKSWDETFYFFPLGKGEDEKKEAHIYNLERAIQEACQQGSIFFRKISPYFPLKKKTWEICKTDHLNNCLQKTN